MGDQWDGGPLGLADDGVTNEKGDQWDGGPVIWGTNEMGYQWAPIMYWGNQWVGRPMRRGPMRWGTSERIPVRWTPSTAVLICHYGICYYRWTPLYTTPGVILTHLKQNKYVQIVTAWHEKIMICLLFVCIGFRIFRLKTSVMQWYTHCLHPHTSRWVCRCLGLVSIWPGHATCWTNSRVAIDPSHKSHNALEKYSMMHHFVTEMCTFLLQNVAFWDSCNFYCTVITPKLPSHFICADCVYLCT